MKARVGFRPRRLRPLVKMISVISRRVWALPSKPP